MISSLSSSYPSYKTSLDAVNEMLEAKKYDEAKEEALSIVGGYYEAVSVLGKLKFNEAVEFDPDKEKEKFQSTMTEAVGYLEKSHNLNPTDDFVAMLLGQGMFIIGKYQEAVEFLETMYLADPEGVDNAVVAAIYECYRELDNKEKLEIYEKVLEERYK